MRRITQPSCFRAAHPIPPGGCAPALAPRARRDHRRASSPRASSPRLAHPRARRRRSTLDSSHLHLHHHLSLAPRSRLRPKPSSSRVDEWTIATPSRERTIDRSIARARDDVCRRRPTDRPRRTTARPIIQTKSMHLDYTYPQYDSTYSIQRSQTPMYTQAGEGKDSNRNGWMRMRPGRESRLVRHTRARASRFAAATSTRSPISDRPNARSRDERTNERTTYSATTRQAGSDLRAHRAGWDPNGELVLGTVLSRTRDSTGVRVFFMRVIRRARARAVSIVRLGLGGSERAREIRRD